MPRFNSGTPGPCAVFRLCDSAAVQYAMLPAGPGSVCAPTNHAAGQCAAAGISGTPDVGFRHGTLQRTAAAAHALLPVVAAASRSLCAPST